MISSKSLALKRAAKAAALCCSLGAAAFSMDLAIAAEPSAFTVAQAPLFLSAPTPNVLLLLDNSNSFDERADGVPVGSNHLTSRSVIARTALRQVVSAYEGKVNMGLMVYKQGSVSSVNLSPTAYDASFEPSTYDPSYTREKALANGWEAFPYTGWATSSYTGAYNGARPCSAPFNCPYTFSTPFAYTGLNWTDTAYTGERRGQKMQYQNFADTRPWQDHPYDFIYYNLIQASYTGTLSGAPSPAPPSPYYCYSRNTLGLHGGASGAGSGLNGNSYSCFWYKNAPLPGTRPDGTQNNRGLITHPTNNTQALGYGFSGAGFSTTYGPTDSDQAQGFTTFGRNMADFGNALAAQGIPAAPTYYQSDAPGKGALKLPIRPLTAANVATLQSRLQCKIPTTWHNGTAYVGDPAQTVACDPNGVVNAGATPSAGALDSAKRYFSGALTSGENETGVSLTTINTTGSATNNLPVSCDKNYVIFVTDGMPTHNASGAMYATPAAALADTVASAQALRDAGVLVYVIGFGAAVQQEGLDQIAAAGGTDTSIVATDSSSLDAALSHVFNDVIVRSASASSVATNSAQFSVDTSIYQARFTSSDWSGQLLKYETDNVTGAVAASATWDSGAALNAQVAASSGWSSSSPSADRRQIIMGKRPGSGDPDGDTVGVPFAWPTNPLSPGSSEMSPWQVLALSRNHANTLDLRGEDRVNWIRGDRSAEGATASTFRTRATSVLGDIVNSYPLYVAPPSSKVNGTGYAAFRAQYAGRRPVIVAGANDGMAHIFDAATGKEIFAYIPSHAFTANPAAAASGARLSQLMRQDYKASHTFIVDGTPVVEDVYYGGAWHSVMVIGAGGGGQNYSALNITNTSNDASKPDPTLTEANASSVALWEFNDRNTNTGTLNAAGVPTGIVNGDKDLGYAFSKPWIGLAHNGKWVAIFGNGYNNTQNDGSYSTTGHGALYVVDISNGRLIRKISVPVGSSSIPNGLGAPRGLDTKLTGKVDYAYAGDLYGNIWKFDLTDANPANWGIAYGGQPLFTVNNINGVAANRRPITGELRVTPNPAGGYMVLFGTGRYIATAAQETPASYDATSMDALYSIWDMETTATRITGPSGNSRGWLNQQELRYATTVSGNVYRQLTNNATTTCAYGEVPTAGNPCTMGCYVELKNYPAAGVNGQRFTYFPQLSGGSASFNTIIPSTNACAAGGNSEQIIFNYLTCASDDQSNFDVNGDQTFSSADLISFTGAPAGSAAGAAGSKLYTGITPPGTRVYNAPSGQIFVYNSSSLGGPPVRDRLRFDPSGGRVSWREVK